MLGGRPVGQRARRYTEGDLEWIQLITRLRGTGMPIRDVRRYADLVRGGPATRPTGSTCSRAHRAHVQAELAG